jgi:hypothetical protein
LFTIDVRNGYLYGTYHDQEVYTRNFVTLYHQDAIDNIKEAQIVRIVPRLAAFTRELLAQENIYLKDK